MENSDQPGQTHQHAPKQPENSFRIVLTVNKRMPRLDVLLLEAIRAQDKNEELKRISRTVFKGLFNDKKILIKGQAAKPSSSLATGTTYVDILGYSEEGSVSDI
ncbi:MAG: hypothetical protein AB7K68_09735 [Bacteriovoracia bacterium]